MRPPERQSPAPGGTGHGAAGHHGRALRGHGSPLALLLSRLESVRPHGRGHRADCPLGHRSRGTLSVGEAENGAVLVKCWAGCETSEVLGALGLTLADLFPERIAPTTPEQRRQARIHASESRWRAALAVLELEAVVILLAAQQVARGENLIPDDLARLATAAERVADARLALAPAQPWRPIHERA